MPAVVNIYTAKEMKMQRHPFMDDPAFRHFFGEQFDAQTRRSTNLGSGVIVSEQGYIITNSHVVEAADEIEVALADTRRAKARVVGTDPETDLAVLKIDLPTLPSILFGQSDHARVGDVVLAIGNPFGVGQTVTFGIISATGRSHLGINTFENFIQTDAAINPGNSGGALINTRGELVGINTGIYTESGGYQGIGFAVPSKLAERIVGDLMQYGEVRRGTIGYIGIEKLSPELAEEYGATSTNGALVSRMSRASEAFDAGVRPGDVIVGFNSVTIADPSQFLRLVSDSKPGTTATVKVLRAGRTLEFKLPIVSSAVARQRR
jgi:serine protease DegQ